MDRFLDSRLTAGAHASAGRAYRARTATRWHSGMSSCFSVSPGDPMPNSPASRCVKRRRMEQEP